MLIIIKPPTEAAVHAQDILCIVWFVKRARTRLWRIEPDIWSIAVTITTHTTRCATKAVNNDDDCDKHSLIIFRVGSQHPVSIHSDGVLQAVQVFEMASGGQQVCPLLGSDHALVGWYLPAKILYCTVQETENVALEEGKWKLWKYHHTKSLDRKLFVESAPGLGPPRWKGQVFQS